MPIPREQFQKGSDTTENNILNFLKEHPEEAYNAKEIAEAFGVINTNSDSVRISFAVYSYSTLLESLVMKKNVTRKIISGVPYYIFLLVSSDYIYPAVTARLTHQNKPVIVFYCFREVIDILSADALLIKAKQGLTVTPMFVQWRILSDQDSL